VPVPLPLLTDVLLATSVPPLFVNVLVPLAFDEVPLSTFKALTVREAPAPRVAELFVPIVKLPLTVTAAPLLVIKSLSPPAGLIMEMALQLNPFVFTFKTPLFVSTPKLAAAIGKL